MNEICAGNYLYKYACDSAGDRLLHINLANNRRKAND